MNRECWKKPSLKASLKYGTNFSEALKDFSGRLNLFYPGIPSIYLQWHCIKNQTAVKYSNHWYQNDREWFFDRIERSNNSLSVIVMNHFIPLLNISRGSLKSKPIRKSGNQTSITNFDENPREVLRVQFSLPFLVFRFHQNFPAAAPLG